MNAQYIEQMPYALDSVLKKTTKQVRIVLDVVTVKTVTAMMMLAHHYRLDTKTQVVTLGGTYKYSTDSDLRACFKHGESAVPNDKPDPTTYIFLGDTKSVLYLQATDPHNDYLSIGPVVAAGYHCLSHETDDPHYAVLSALGVTHLAHHPTYRSLLDAADGRLLDKEACAAATVLQSYVNGSESGVEIGLNKSWTLATRYLDAVEMIEKGAESILIDRSNGVISHNLPTWANPALHWELLKLGVNPRGFASVSYISDETLKLSITGAPDILAHFPDVTDDGWTAISRSELEKLQGRFKHPGATTLAALRGKAAI